MGGIRRECPRRAALPFRRHRRDSRDGQRHGGRRGASARERRLRHDRSGGRRGGPAHTAARGRPDALGRASGHRRGRTNVRRQGFRGGTDHGEGSVSIEADRQRAALHRVAADDPELAARLVLMTLPAAASRVSGTLAYELEIAELGSYLVSISGGRARVDEARSADHSEFRLQTDARTLIDLVTGTAGPLGLMMRGRLRVRGKRRKALKLRQMSSGDVSMADVVDAGGTLKPDILYRSLPYLIDPGWTAGHDFTVRYDVSGDGGGTWYLGVRDGERVEVARELPEGREVAGTATVSLDSYQRLASGQISPSHAMQNQLTTVEGEIHPVTLVGRWIARAQGTDDAELKRERKQRKLQEQRRNLYSDGGIGGPGQGDPGHEAEG